LGQPFDSLKWLELRVSELGAKPYSARGNLRVADPQSPVGFRNIPLTDLVVRSDTLAFRAPEFPGGTLSFRGRFLVGGVFADLPDNSAALAGECTAPSGRRATVRFVFTVGD
jgi:hypothetical protein